VTYRRAFEESWRVRAVANTTNWASSLWLTAGWLMVAQCTQPICPWFTDPIRVVVGTFDTDSSGVLSDNEPWALCKARDVLQRQKHRKLIQSCKIINRAGQSVDTVGCGIAGQPSALLDPAAMLLDLSTEWAGAAGLRLTAEGELGRRTVAHGWRLGNETVRNEQSSLPTSVIFSLTASLCLSAHSLILSFFSLFFSLAASLSLCLLSVLLAVSPSLPRSPL
jgi:hypothetical protein